MHGYLYESTLWGLLSPSLPIGLVAIAVVISFGAVVQHIQTRRDRFSSENRRGAAKRKGQGSFELHLAFFYIFGAVLAILYAAALSTGEVGARGMLTIFFPLLFLAFFLFTKRFSIKSVGYVMIATLLFSAPYTMGEFVPAVFTALKGEYPFFARLLSLLGSLFVPLVLLLGKTVLNLIEILGGGVFIWYATRNAHVLWGVPYASTFVVYGVYAGLASVAIYLSAAPVYTLAVLTVFALAPVAVLLREWISFPSRR